MERQKALGLFRELTERKTRRALEAVIPGFKTVFDKPFYQMSFEVVLGNSWTHKLFDGAFYRTRQKFPDLPQLSTVFVQDKNGNTDTASGNPGDLGGGETDLHLIYEGVSRIDADGVMAGANTIRGSNTVFSIWHPRLIELRKNVKPRSHYPAQIVVTASGQIDMENELMFNLPEIPVYVITTEEGAKILSKKKGYCGQVYFISTGNSINYHDTLRMLKSFGLNRISVVGGRTTVSELFDQGFISDLYLTTSSLETGLSNTPFYVGKKGLVLGNPVLKKIGKDTEQGVVFEYYSFQI